MIQRLLSPLKSNSFFLFGPRGTGKTTFLKVFFDHQTVEYIDLLQADEEDVFARNPHELEHRVHGLVGFKDWIVLDEIQRLPRLLDAVHRLIESTTKKFALTGSSSRKLKHGASNLLAGRAFVNHLHPLTIAELSEQISLTDLLRFGGLPKTLQLATEVEKKEYLRAYAHTYLREEIAAQQMVRKLEPFRNFLSVAAQYNGQIINASKIARDVGADSKTVQSYFTILEDTMMGFLLPAWHQSVRKRQACSPKFYFFDTGVKRALDRTVSQELYEGSFAYGNAFEHLVILELFRMNDYCRSDFRFSYLRVHGGKEVDLIIERPGKPLALVEIKSTTAVSADDCSVVNSLSAEIKDSMAYCISRDMHRKKIGNTICLHYRDAVYELGLRT